MIGDPSFREGQLLRIFVGEDATWHHQPLFTAIVDLLRREGIAGASVFRGVEGFGAHHEIHLNRIFAFGAKMPVLIEAIDQEAKIAALIPRLEQMLGDGGVITLERVEYRRFLPTR
jgi:PII-like signaling protein